MVLRHYGKPGDGRPVHVPGTNICWHGLGGYVEAVHAEICPLKASSKRYARNERLYRSLAVDDIESCLDPAMLRRAEQLFDRGRYVCSASGLAGCLGREVVAQLLVECRNQVARVDAGRSKRVKGPRLDPGLVPTGRLLILIQRHRNMEVVEALRRELRRRTHS